MVLQECTCALLDLRYIRNNPQRRYPDRDRKTTRTRYRLTGGGRQIFYGDQLRRNVKNIRRKATVLVTGNLRCEGSEKIKGTP